MMPGRGEGTPRHRPRKRFGQHFLHDRRIIERLAGLIDPRPGELVVEIGPGEGALTLPLLARGARVLAVEIDRDLAAGLRARAAGHPGLEVLEADALALEIERVAAPGEPVRVAGNLPYNISSPLVFHLLQSRGRIRDMTFMLQREVVERMSAPPGGRDYGRLSVMVQAACRVERLMTVPPGAFRPPPQVHSAVVRLSPYTVPPLPMPDSRVFAELVRRAFGQRRKTLRNALRGYAEEALLRSTGLDPAMRAERVTVEQFARLAAAVAAAGEAHPAGRDSPCDESHE